MNPTHTDIHVDAPKLKKHRRPQESDAAHHALVEECPFGICRFNLKTRRYDTVNPTLLSLSGYTHEEFCGEHAPQFYVDTNDRDYYAAELHSNGYVRDFECALRRKDGSSIRASLSSFVRVDAKTGTRYIHAYVLDMTRQRALEEQLSHAHRMEAVGRLAGGVAHDFNNITQSIGLSCELALQSKPQVELASKFKDIMQQTARAAEITRQLLAFSRRQVLQPRAVDINEVIHEAMPMLTRMMGANVDIELSLDVSAERIFIDPDQLAIVLMHLADNSRRAMPGGGRFTLTTSRSATNFTSPHGELSAPCVLLTISDTGVGMDEHTLNHIFEPFFSTRHTTRTTGLGLSTVHGIITQSKGRIECTSSPGDGARFYISLPIANASPAPRPRISGVSGIYRVLLAEDDAMVNKHLTTALAQSGCAVDSVCNGQEALRAFERQPYQILVTDIVMPRLGGIELAHRLRRRHPRLPVVLISGYSEEASAIQTLAPEYTAYLQKPFVVSQLMSAIRALLST